MNPKPISSCTVLRPAAPLLAALLLASCATEVRDEMPGRAQTLPPAQAQAQAQGRAEGPGAGLKTLRQLQEEANTREAGRAVRPSQPPTQPSPPPQRTVSQDDGQPQPPPPVRRRGSSSPPPPPAVQPAVPSLPPPPSTQAQTDRAKRDLLSPEVDRLRTEDAMGRLDPLQQRDLFRKEQDLRQYGNGLPGSGLPGN